MTAPGWQRGPNNAITDVPGIRVGHWTDRPAATGCTVILCDGCATAAVDVRGGAPGTRETDVLGPANLVRRCDAVLFAGGSAFGLAAATGVARWCREQGIGYETAAARVPIVSTAVLYDLALGRGDAWPGDDDGYAAAASARRGRVARGTVGAGTGATVAKLGGPEGRIKGGVGTASVVARGGLVVGALAVTNAVGSLFDPSTGELVAGPWLAGEARMLGLPELLARPRPSAASDVQPGENTTLVCVATNATLEHAAVQRLAYQAHDGMARVIVPAHTLGDGDIAFAVSMGTRPTFPEDALIAGIMTVHAVEAAILDSVRAATRIARTPALRDIAPLLAPGR